MMNSKLILHLIILFLFIFSCKPKQHYSESATSNNNDGWAEMDSFHMTMTEAFYPLKDSGNLEPTTRLVIRLADEADKWASSPLPEKVNNDEMRKRLQELKTDLQSLKDEINKGATEDNTGTALYRIHDQFHEIMEVWHADNMQHEHEEKR